MNFDLVYAEIGDLGRYQKYILVLSGFTSLYAGFLFISSFFTLAIPKHRYVYLLVVNNLNLNKSLFFIKKRKKKNTNSYFHMLQERPKCNVHGFNSFIFGYFARIKSFQCNK